ncbi:MAG: alcohol dehydrogenase catalytic domain-containing protein, partial [Anaerolineae bacterium]|nr:alcohol dehydrogenase catalytic domain-containing protein [Anaerolineae bacterium]
MWAAFDAHHFFEKNIPKILLTMALRSLWPGVVFSPLSPSRLAELPDPALPGPHWVRVRNRLCGVCASDLHLLFARTAPQVSPAALPGTERIYLGHEVLGEVVEVGAGVTTWQEGDRVIMDAHGINCVNQAIDPPCRHCRKGNYSLCENTSVGQGPHGVGGGWSDGFTAHEIGVYRVPDDLDDETAMLIEPLS